MLKLLADKQELTVTKVAEGLGLHRTGSHRFLATLRELGYVEKNANNRYQLTFEILELGMKFANRFEIRRIARPFMESVLSRFNETVNLGYWDGKNVVHLDKTETQEVLRIDPGIGTLSPAYCTGLGKAILAFLREEEREAYLKSTKLVPFTPNTLTERESLEEELRKTRERGYAIDDEELAVGLCCVDGPVFDYTGFPKYSISIAGPATRMTNEVMEQMKVEVRKTCARLSSYVGEPGHEEKYSGLIGELESGEG